MKNVRVHIWVSGRVQGVFYRQTTLQQAVSLNIKGWVRNLIDGRVEAVFEGEEKSVNQMVKWCRKGPSNAFVSTIEVIEEKYSEEFSDFIIR